MSEQLQLDYYYGADAEQFNFLMVPKFLLKEERFVDLSDGAKLLYSLMLDRMSLSRKNNWFDEENRAYIYYGVENAMKEMRRSKPTIIKYMKELEVLGLIERHKAGQGNPTTTYVKKFTTEKKPLNPDEQPEVKNVDFKKSKHLTSKSKDSEPQEVKSSDLQRERNLTSRGKGSEPQEVNGFAPNYTENNYTENNQTESNYTERSYTSPVMSCPDDEEDDSWLDGIDTTKPIRLVREQPKDRRTERDIYIEILKEQVQYDRLCDEDTYHDRMDIVDGIINIIADIATTEPPDGYERINGRQYPHNVVKSRLLKMDYDTITHVLGRFKENKTEIRNMRSYLLTALYNAKDEKDIQFQNFFNNTYYNTDWQAEKSKHSGGGF